MDVQHKDDGSKGTFSIEIDGKVAAKMTYTWAGEGRIIIDHTEVDDFLRGKGAGKMMVIKAVEFARERKITILPLCPFAKSVFDKESTFNDVLN